MGGLLVDLKKFSIDLKTATNQEGDIGPGGDQKARREIRDKESDQGPGGGLRGVYLGKSWVIREIRGQKGGKVVWREIMGPV